jgi:tRNA G18 (ribose-2'-O)-methylase SpoU
VEQIDDPEDPRLGDYRHLTDAAARRAVEHGGGGGIFIAEGLLALRQLLRSPFRVRSILATPARVDAVRAELDEVDSPVGPTVAAALLVAPREVLESVTGYDVHRGVLAAADRGSPVSAEQVLPGTSRLLVIAGVNDTENLGALFRNAAALGMHGVVLDDTAADPLYRRSIRVSAGWSLRMPYVRMGSARGIPAALRTHGFRTVALTPGDGAVPVDHAAATGVLDDPVALVVGAEGPGLSPDVLEHCDVGVRIPMSGEVDSLNVATSFAVVATYAAARRSWA